MSIAGKASVRSSHVRRHRYRRLSTYRRLRTGAVAILMLVALLQMPSRSPAEAETTSGLNVIVAERGKITASYDAEGTAGASGQLSISKPAGGTLRRAVLFAATTGFTSSTMPGPVTVSVEGAEAEPHEVLMGHGTPSGISSYNYWADATTALKADLDSAPSGDVRLAVKEPAPESAIDGVALAVVFDDPAKTAESSVTLLFGALLTGGDHFDVRLERPFNLADPAAQLEMSLGISYSCQTAGPCGSSGQQYSEVDVGGKRLTSAAGGEDDGVSANGGLITIGGTGDKTENPPDPNATPTDPRSDDELYDLRPFLTDGQSSIQIDTRNPSGDDNIFFAAFAGNPPITDITTGGDKFVYVALGDSYSSGEGAGFNIRPSAAYLADGYENGSNFPPQVGPQDNTYSSRFTPPGDTCHRALLNYAKINRDRFKPGAEIVLVDRTCSGATIASTSPKPPIVGDVGKPVDARSQVQQAVDRLAAIGLTPSDVDLVTVGMGGNDAGFGNIVAACLAPAMSRIILEKYPNSPGELKFLAGLLSCQAVDSLGTKTDAAIKSLKDKEVDAQKKILDAFPAAKVLQLDYPSILPAKNAPEYCGGIDRGDIEFARKKIKKINESIRKAIEQTDDPRLGIAEMEAAFGSNALCPASAGTALANGIGRDAVDREVSRLLNLSPGGDATTRGLVDALVRRYSEYKGCLANQANPFDGSACNLDAAFSRMKAAADAVLERVKNQEELIFANLVSAPGTTDDSQVVAYDRSRGLFHPNAKGFAVAACNVLAAYESSSPDGCLDSPVPPVSTANGQFVGSAPLRAEQRGTVELIIRGFAAATQVFFTLFSKPQPLGSATADSSGVVRATVTLPELPGGVHRLQLEGSTPDGVAYTQEVRLQLPGRPNGTYATYLTGFDKEPAVIDPAADAELVDVTLDGQPIGTFEPDENGGILVEMPLSGRLKSSDDFLLKAVSRRTGKAVIETVKDPVPVAASLWATSRNADALRITGVNVTADGRVHSEGGITVRGSSGALTGGVEYASTLTVAGSPIRIKPAARKVAAGQGNPAQLDITSYRLGGAVERSGARYTAIRKADCVNGYWTPRPGIQLSGTVYVPCGVILSGPRRSIDATIAAEGKILVLATGLTVGPTVSGPALVSGAAGAKAITIAAASVETRGVVVAPAGEVVIVGSATTQRCGIQAQTINLAGAGIRLPMSARCLA